MEKQASRYIKTGVAGFDALFTNGIPRGTAVLIEGGPGSGKTMFCLQICCNFAKAGIKTLYMSFEEPESRLIDHITDGIGIDVKPLIEKGFLQVKRFSALDIARSVEALLTEAKKELLIDVNPILIPRDFSPEIVVFDSLTSISSAFSGEKYRFRIYMDQLFRYLETNKINSFLIRETTRPTHIGLPVALADEAVSFLSDGIVVLYNVFYESGNRGRALEVLKMRGEDIKKKLVKLEIVNKKGVIVFPDTVSIAQKGEKFVLT